MGKRKIKKHAPVVTVPSDDFEVDGKHPHEGETVTFRKRISSRDLLVLARAGSMGEDAETGDEEQDKKVKSKAMATFFHGDACEMLSRAIHEWTWTDMFTGEELELSVDTLRDIDALTELQYLLEKWLDLTSPQEKDGKNQQEPSSEQ